MNHSAPFSMWNMLLKGDFATPINSNRIVLSKTMQDVKSGAVVAQHWWFWAVKLIIIGSHPNYISRVSSVFLISLPKRLHPCSSLVMLMICHATSLTRFLWCPYNYLTLSLSIPNLSIPFSVCSFPSKSPFSDPDMVSEGECRLTSTLFKQSTMYTDIPYGGNPQELFNRISPVFY